MPKAATKPMRVILDLPLASLTVSKVNVRRHGGRDVASLAQSIRAKGLIYPLLVRKLGRDEYDIVAGRRRFLALQKLDKAGDLEPATAPCIVIDDDTDAHAHALELSLIENTERLPMDLLDQYTAFAALAREGRSEAEIAHTFSLSLATVKKRLALANLVPDAHARYRSGDLDDRTLEILTLGSKERQRAYLRLIDDPEQQPPPVWQLKQWMLQGAAIEARHALFDIASYPAPLMSDLFGDTTYCTDADAFWSLQRAAVAALADDLRGKGWPGVTVLDPDQPFNAHQWHPATKAEGGHVVVKLHASGEVQIEKGLIHRDELKKRQRSAPRTVNGSANGSGNGTGRGNGEARDGSGDLVPTPPGGLVTGAAPEAELTAPLRNYTDLVRQSACCAVTLTRSGYPF